MVLSRVLSRGLGGGGGSGNCSCNDTTVLKAFLNAADTQIVHHWLVGDSNAVFAGHGWDDGLQHGLTQQFPSFSTGFVSPNSNSTNGFAVGYFSRESAADIGQTSGAPEFCEQYSPRGSTSLGGILDYSYVAEGSAVSTFVGPAGIAVLNGSPLDVNSALTFEGWWVSFASGAGEFRPRARLGVSPFSFLGQGPLTSTNTGTDGDLIKAEVSIAAGTRDADLEFGWLTPGGTNITGPFFSPYCRVRKSEGTNGYAFSTLAYRGGQSARIHALAVQSQSDTFYANIFGIAREDCTSRSQTPKHIFWLNSGLNDRNETNTSVGPNLVADGDAPEAFADNCLAIIKKIEAIWAANSWPLSELHFAIMPSHPISDPDDTDLISYRQAASNLAASSPRRTFVDITSLYNSGDFTAGSWYDGGGTAHLTETGYRAVGAGVIAALIA